MPNRQDLSLERGLGRNSGWGAVAVLALGLLDIDQHHQGLFVGGQTERDSDAAKCAGTSYVRATAGCSELSLSQRTSPRAHGRDCTFWCVNLDRRILQRPVVERGLDAMFDLFKLRAEVPGNEPPFA